MSTTVTRHYLDLLVEHGYLTDDHPVDHAISPDNQLHLSPDQCWPGPGKPTDTTAFGNLRRRYQARLLDLCQCGVWRTLVRWGHHHDPAADQQLIWLAEALDKHTDEQPTTGLAVATEITLLHYQWMTRPAPSSNRSLTAAVTTHVDQLWRRRNELMATPEYRVGLASILRSGVRDYHVPLGNTISRSLAAAHGNAEFGETTQITFPTSDGNQLDDDAVIDRYVHPFVWALYDDFDAAVTEALVHCHPDRDGYRVQGAEVLVRVPAAVVVFCRTIAGSVVGLDNGYTADEVAAVQDIVSDDIPLADAVAALRAARH